MGGNQGFCTNDSFIVFYDYSVETPPLSAGTCRLAFVARDCSMEPIERRHHSRWQWPEINTTTTYDIGLNDIGLSTFYRMRRYITQIKQLRAIEKVRCAERAVPSVRQSGCLMNRPLDERAMKCGIVERFPTDAMHDWAFDWAFIAQQNRKPYYMRLMRIFHWDIV